MVSSNSMTLGDWLRKKRQEQRLSQQDVVDMSNGALKQSTISSYELNKVKELTVQKLFVLGAVLGIEPKDFPWYLLDENYVRHSRLSMYELPKTANSVKLFNGKIYEIEGFLGKELESGKVKKISEIYYQVRSAAYDGTVCAKRKKPHDELRRTI